MLPPLELSMLFRATSPKTRTCPPELAFASAEPFTNKVTWTPLLASATLPKAIKSAALLCAPLLASADIRSACPLSETCAPEEASTSTSVTLRRTFIWAPEEASISQDVAAMSPCVCTCAPEDASSVCSSLQLRETFTVPLLLPHCNQRGPPGFST